VSGRFAYEPSAALAPDGTAAVLWSRQLARGRRLLELSVAPPGGRFGRPRRLADVHANITAWRVFSAGGRFVTIWWQGVPGHDHAIRYAVGSGPIQTLAEVDGDGGISAAAGPSGEVVAAWTTAVLDGARAMSATLPAGTDRFGAPVELEPGAEGNGPETPQVFGGPGGVALGYIPYGLPWKVQVATPGSPPRVLAKVPNKGDTTELDGPRVALPQTGAVAAWAVTKTAFEESEEPVSGRVDAAVQQPDGSFSPPVRLTPAHEFPTAALTAGATRAAAVVLWGAKRSLRYVVHAGEKWTRAATLAPAPDSEITVAAAGDHLMAGWLDGRTIRVAELH
jgi:hypothetical protein